jgi:3-isopropylmalate dehydratase small subunit
MEPIKIVEGKVVPLKAENIDTDQIIPAQFLRLLSKKGLGRYLFYRLRYDEEGRPKPGFIMDDPRFKDATIIVAGKNFGIGSSRENAVWALTDFGIKAVIAPSFGDIFYGNAVGNGLACIKLEEEKVEELQERAKEGNLFLKIDLEASTIETSYGEVIRFEMEPYIKKKLILGLDDIKLALQHAKAIESYEKRLPSFLRINSKRVFLE